MIRYAILACLLQAVVNAVPVDFEPQLQRSEEPITRIPAPDGLLHIYTLPVGQGDAIIIQCPSGTLNVMDMGSSDGASAGYWAAPELTNFLQGSFNRINSVILSHNHADHYSFLSTVLTPSIMTGLQNIYGSCLYDDLVNAVKNWVDAIGVNKLRIFNNGQECGPNGTPCTTISLCPGDSGVTVLTMAVNMGQQCRNSGGNKNMDSVVFKVTYGGVSVVFNGDFEDSTATQTNGPQTRLANYYGPDARVTVYKLSHHGAENLANKAVSRNAHSPKATFVSGNSFSSQGYYHPRCNINDAFINEVGTICRPEVTDTASRYYCGVHPYSLPVTSRVQRTQTCGFTGGTLRTITNNQDAIYTTVPDANTLNIVELAIQSNGRWGFINNFSPKIVRTEPIDEYPIEVTDEEIHACSNSH